MSQPADDPAKKIIIDEDWKAQVEREKEVAAKQSAAGAAPSASPAKNAEGDLPPATLSFLVTSLAMQAMMSMGLMPNPITGKSEVNLAQARHFIDTVEMLEEKTKGNRSAEEDQVLDNLLYELRMAFVAVSEHQPRGADPSAARDSTR